MITPQLDKARTAIEEHEARAAAERANLEAQMAEARNLQQQWAAHEDAVESARKAAAYVSGKIVTIGSRIKKASDEIAALAPTWDFSPEWFGQNKINPLEDSPSDFLKWGGKNPFFHYGFEIAAGEKALQVLNGEKAVAEKKVSEALKAAKAFASKHGIECNLEDA